MIWLLLAVIGVLVLEVVGLRTRLRKHERQLSASRLAAEDWRFAAVLWEHIATRDKLIASFHVDGRDIARAVVETMH